MLLRSRLQFNVGFLSHDELVFGELRLVCIQFLFEHRDLTFSVLVPQLTQLALVLLFELGLLEVEVLLLCLDNHCQLRLLRL